MGEGALIGLAGGEEDPARDRMIQIKTDMDFGFLGALPIVGPGHGENGIDEGPVNADQISQVTGVAGENALGFEIKGFEYFQELFQASSIDGFEETAFFNSLLGGDGVVGEVIFFEGLEEMSSRGVFFEVEVD